jgi:hypothetical protein
MAFLSLFLVEVAGLSMVGLPLAMENAEAWEERHEDRCMISCEKVAVAEVVGRTTVER